MPTSADAPADIFSTRDLSMAATLITLKFPLVDIDYQIEGTKRDLVGYFKFSATKELKDARQKYTQGMLLVEPKLFMTNVHSLKAEVKNAMTNPHNKAW